MERTNGTLYSPTSCMVPVCYSIFGIVQLFRKARDVKGDGIRSTEGACDGKNGNGDLARLISILVKIPMVSADRVLPRSVR